LHARNIYYPPEEVHDSGMDWQKKQRLRAIEIILYWHGRLNTGDIIKAFGISRIQASKDIKTYITMFAGNMYYNLTDRAYLKGNPFKLYLTTGNIDEYIDHISRMSEPYDGMSIERIAPHYRALKPSVAGAVLQAIKAKQGLLVNYGSMRTPEGNSRIIYPHSLVDTGFRWHIRAYCNRRGEFRDFNLGRILDTPEILKDRPEEACVDHDSLWNEAITLALRANPALSEAQQRLIEMEFGIEQKTLLVPTRACLVHYALQRYQINLDQVARPAKTQMLVVDNLDDLKEHLF